MVRHSLNTCFGTCRFKALLAGNVNHNVSEPFPDRSCPTLALTNPLEQICHRCRDRDVSTVSRLSRLDPDAVVCFVDILPPHPTGFSQPAATERHELDQIAASLRATGSAGSDSLDHLLELLR